LLFTALNDWLRNGQALSYTVYIGTSIIVTVEEKQTNLVSLLIKTYFTSSTLNMFRTLIHPSSEACDFSILYHIVRVFFFRCVLEFRRGWIGVVSVWQSEACYTDITSTQPHRNSNNIETRTNNQCGDTIKKSQVPDDGCINVRNMLSIEEVK